MTDTYYMICITVVNASVQNLGGDIDFLAQVVCIGSDIAPGAAWVC